MIDTEVARLFDRRSALFLTAGAVMTSALVLRMLQMQVFNYSDYKQKSENNSFRIRVDLPKRGEITDTAGMPISHDTPTYRVYIVPEESDDTDGLIKNLTNELKLRTKTLNRINRTIKKQARFQPVLISENSDWKKLAGLHAQNLPGLHIESGFARIYEMGAAGAQIFGYVGAPSKPISGAPFWMSGITGLEKTFDTELLGTPGQTVMIANAVGRITGEDKSQFAAPTSGKTIRTTIVDSAQRALYKSLSESGAGAGVAIDIKTGDILAMASAPGFDPNKFGTDDGEEYIAQLRNDIAKPFMNKTIEGLYPPGSTFKMVVALAALESGALLPTEKIFCPGHWDYGDRRYHCWERKGHGWVDLAGAIAHSCDTYFYQIALRIGIDSIKQMALRLGFGETYMNDILPREMAGIIPDRRWKDKNIGATWVHGDTIISGIGQGYILTNILQLCIMTSRIVSNTAVIPNIIKTKNKKHFASLNLQKKNINYIMRGMDAVLEKGGTAFGAAINVRGQKMGGKTGTAQVRSISAAERASGVLTKEQLQWRLRDHGLFVAYAPTNNPRFAVATLAEHAGGSGPSARAAAAVMKELLKI